MGTSHRNLRQKLRRLSIPPARSYRVASRYRGCAHAGRKSGEAIKHSFIGRINSRASDCNFAPANNICNVRRAHGDIFASGDQTRRRGIRSLFVERGVINFSCFAPALSCTPAITYTENSIIPRAERRGRKKKRMSTSSREDGKRGEAGEGRPEGNLRQTLSTTCGGSIYSR